MAQTSETVAVPDLPSWVWGGLLDDLHERAVALYEAGDRAVADTLAEWVAVLDWHAGNLDESCVHIVCETTGRCLFVSDGDSA